jgi:hypothetical protein
MRLTCLIAKKNVPRDLFRAEKFYRIFPKKFSCREISLKKSIRRIFPEDLHVGRIISGNRSNHQLPVIFSTELPAAWSA